MDLKQLNYYVTIVDEGSISAAAKKLHISQPPLSMQMKLLEQELGTVLFERGIRNITLTDAGELLYERARGILDMVSATRMEIDALGHGLRGTLRLGLISSANTVQTAARLADFREKYPGINFHIYEGNTYQLLNSLKVNQIDLALIRTPFPVAGLSIKRFGGGGFVAAGRPGAFDGLASSSSDHISVEMLIRLPVIIYRRWEPDIRAVFEKNKLTLQPVCVTDNTWTGIQMVRAGMGVALLPENYVADMKDLEIRTVAVPELRSEVALVCRDERYMTNIARLFFETFEI